MLFSVIDIIQYLLSYLYEIHFSVVIYLTVDCIPATLFLTGWKVPLYADKITQILKSIITCKMWEQFESPFICHIKLDHYTEDKVEMSRRGSYYS